MNVKKNRKSKIPSDMKSSITKLEEKAPPKVVLEETSKVEVESKGGSQEPSVPAWVPAKGKPLAQRIQESLERQKESGVRATAFLEKIHAKKMEKAKQIQQSFQVDEKEVKEEPKEVESAEVPLDDEIRTYRREYYLKNKDKIAEKRKLKREEEKKKIAEYERLMAERK